MPITTRKIFNILIFHIILITNTSSFIVTSSSRDNNIHYKTFLNSQTISSSTTTSSSSSGNIGDADRSFQLGLDLEKKGLARAASASFHEAATLYQCFIDNYDYNDSSSNEFGHGMFLIFLYISCLTYTCFSVFCF